MIRVLKPAEIRRICDPNDITCQSTKELGPLDQVIAQERAVRAIEFGLGITEHGFNIFAAGPHGTGRVTTVKAAVEKLARTRPVPDDWVYVQNFSNPLAPDALSLPAGKGREFKRDMENLVSDLKIEIARVFESDEYEKQKNQIAESLTEERNRIVHEIEEKAKAKGFSLQSTPMGFVALPVVDNKPLTQEEFFALRKEKQDEIKGRQTELQQEMNQGLKKINRFERQLRDRVKDLDREIALNAVGQILEDLQEKYRDHSRIPPYLKAVKEDILQNIDDFRKTEEPSPLPFLKMSPSFDRYSVNLVVDNAEQKGLPIVYESNPTFPNLFGRVDRKAQFGMLTTDFSMIRPGALHRANGGFLILNDRDLLTRYYAWEGLKRALKEEEIRIEDISEQLGFATTETIKPQPIPFNIKVIIVGEPMIYYLLYAHDPDFRELFKIHSAFDYQMERSPEAISLYAGFIASRCRELKLRHLSREAVSRVIEFGSELSDDQEKLSTRFSDISDLLVESNLWAERSGSGEIQAANVEKALEEKIYRSSLYEEKVREMIARGYILLEAEGEKIGQINGLSVIFLGNYMFGRPNRITAPVSLGREGIIDIERRADLGGKIHSKGIMIISGFLAGRYAQDKPLSLSASICFEQSYEGVEGDSASAAELIALLSSLSGAPIRQSIAITGSVNQMGEIQPIGGVNRKIEGFFEVCKIKKVNGVPGVIVPESNVKNLMLKPEVVRAVSEGKFRIIAVSHVDEALEVLTGIPAGKRTPEGKWEEGSLNARVDARVRKMSEELARLSRPNQGKEDTAKEENKNPK
ncbi:MAG: ATP-binding protein [bacterium]|nr:ATP-binding protein [bacterium]